MEVVVDLISNIGFPIAAYLILFWYMKQNDEQHQQQIEELRTTVESNTNAIITLTERIAKND